MPKPDQFKHELLTAAEERELAQRIENGDRAARQRLIECNLRLVVHYVNQLTVEDRHRDDLVQEGNLGLIIAADKFDWRMGTKFSTYATWWIRQRIRKAMPGLNEIGRLPQHIWDKFWRYQRTGEAEVAEEDLDKAGRFLRAVTSIDDTIFSHHSDPDAIVTRISQQELIERLEDLVECLEPRKKKILMMRFGIGFESWMTLREIAQRIRKAEGRKLSVESVRKIAQSAVEDLKKLLGTSLTQEP